MEQFSRKHYEKIAKEMNLNDTQLKIAIDEILKLNPKPGNSMSEGSKGAQDVIPDFIINNNGGELELILNSRNMPDLRVANVYMQMLNEYSQRKDRTGKEAATFVKQKIENAKTFIDTIRQRSETLYMCMKCIMDFQKEFFLKGDEKLLKPMVLKDVAAKTGMDISTISRVSNSKYVQTPFGMYLLKYFFSEALTTDEGEEVSSREVKQILRECVDKEDKKKPLTDDALTKILKEKGYNIARRTVAKYREMLEIPVARLRKKL
jgi:RNA polymerase sigma-54 factor